MKASVRKLFVSSKNDRIVVFAFYSILSASQNIREGCHAYLRNDVLVSRPLLHPVGGDSRGMDIGMQEK